MEDFSRNPENPPARFFVVEFRYKSPSQRHGSHGEEHRALAERTVESVGQPIR